MTDRSPGEQSSFDCLSVRMFLWNHRVVQQGHENACIDSCVLFR